MSCRRIIFSTYRILQMKDIIIKEEFCECGFVIPLGYGYYEFGKSVRCRKCGKINKKEKLK